MSITKTKPIVLAICGKSASGKTTLAKWLERYFNQLDLPARRMISTTTRPPRVDEKNGEDYYFVSLSTFNSRKSDNIFLETAKFRKWEYGMYKTEIHPDCINIGVFNAEGIKNLQRYKQYYTIIPIYLKEDFDVRLQRSVDRENKFKLEYLRRYFADEWDFRHIEHDIKSFRNYIILDRMRGVWDSSLIIWDRLVRFNVVQIDEDGSYWLNTFYRYGG